MDSKSSNAIDQNTFSWKNYFRPSPHNLQIWVQSIHGALVLVVGSSYLAGVSPEHLLWVMLAGYFLDQLSQFFGRVDADMQHMNISVEGKNISVTDVSNTTSVPQST